MKLIKSIKNIHTIYESLESKIGSVNMLSMGKGYEFFNYDWKLPLI